MSKTKDSTQEVATQWSDSNPTLVQRGIDESGWNALKTSVFPGAQDNSILMAVDYCRSRQLDIMMKPVHIVPMYVSDKQTNQKGMRDVIMPGVGMYRIQAERAGNYAGADAVEYGPMIDGVFTDSNGNKVECRFPEFATMTVYKTMSNGERVGFTVTEYWEENYATAGRDVTAPNSMWKKRPRAQLAKCVEAQCLRRGWPEIGQEVTAEEMEGKTFDTMKTVNGAPNTEAEVNAAPASTAKHLPDEQWAARFPLWEKGIADGSTGIDQIKTFLTMKGFELSAIQLDQLNSVNPVIEG